MRANGTEGGDALPRILARVNGATGPPTNISCNISCAWIGRDSHVNEGRIEGTNLTFVLSMEGPRHYPRLVDPRISIHATGDMLSDVPCPWLNRLSQIYVDAPPYEGLDRRASFVARNCASLNHRERWVREIQTVHPVASIGTCMHNAERPFRARQSKWLEDKVELTRHYMFHLAFENQNAEHMTEKLHFALASGTIPVYMGDARAARWSPRHSFINALDFPNGFELGAYLKRVAENETLYKSYHAWRSRPPEAHLVRFFAPMERYHVKCRICQRAHALLAGERSARAARPRRGRHDKDGPRDGGPVAGSSIRKRT